MTYSRPLLRGASHVRGPRLFVSAARGEVKALLLFKICLRWLILNFSGLSQSTKSTLAFEWRHRTPGWYRRASEHYDETHASSLCSLWFRPHCSFDGPEFARNQRFGFSAGPGRQSLHNSPIYSEVIPTQFVPPTPGPNDWKEEFTAPNGKLVTVLVQAPRGTGVYSRPIGNGETPDEYFPSVVSEAIARGAHKIVIPYGTYNFKGPAMTETGPCTVNTWPLCSPNTHWTIGNYLGFGPTIEDLDIDGSGSTLNFNAPLTGIQMYNVGRIRFHNFTLDWPNAPVAALGTIVLDPTNPGHNAVVIDNSFPVSATNPNFTVNGYPQIQAINTWDGDDWTGHFNSLAGNNIPSDEVYFLWTPSNNLPIYVGKTSAGDQTYSCQDCNFIKSKNPNDCSYYANCANFDYFRLGARVVVRYLTYNGWAINVSFSDDVDFDHLTVLSSPGNGINFGTGGGYRGARVADSIFTRAQGRPVSVASGPVNLSQFTGDIIFENDVIAYQGDESTSPRGRPISIGLKTSVLTAAQF